MTLDDLSEWQALAPTKAVLGFYESALMQAEDLNIDPTDMDPSQFWRDSMKAKLAEEVLGNFVELLSDPEALLQEIQAHEE